MMITHQQEIEIKNKMIEAKNDEIVKLEMEVERLRHALNQIASVSEDNFYTPKAFQAWAQNRARLALGLKPGELTIRKG